MTFSTERDIKYASNWSVSISVPASATTHLSAAHEIQVCSSSTADNEDLMNWDCILAEDFLPEPCITLVIFSI